jgi:hypothetical protein
MLYLVNTVQKRFTLCNFLIKVLRVIGSHYLLLMYMAVIRKIRIFYDQRSWSKSSKKLQTLMFDVPWKRGQIHAMYVCGAWCITFRWISSWNSRHAFRHYITQCIDSSTESATYVVRAVFTEIYACFWVGKKYESITPESILQNSFGRNLRIKLHIILQFFCDVGFYCFKVHINPIMLAITVF